MLAFEAEIRALVESEIEKRRDSFRVLGVTCSPVRLEIWNADRSERKSELSVEFYFGEQLIDVYEFFVFDKGERAVTLEGVRSWVEKSIDETRAEAVKRAASKN